MTSELQSDWEGSGGSARTWRPDCWLSHLEPKQPLGQSPLLGSKIMLDLQGNFSFEDLSSWLPSSPARSPSPAVPLRVVPTLSTTDMKTAGELWSGARAWRGVEGGYGGGSSTGFFLPGEEQCSLALGGLDRFLFGSTFFTNRPASIPSFTLKISLRS